MLTLNEGKGEKKGGGEGGRGGGGEGKGNMHAQNKKGFKFIKS